MRETAEKKAVAQLFIIAEIVCREYGVKVINLQKDTREREFVEPRQVVCNLARKLIVGRFGSPMTYTAIGLELAKRDHASAIHSYKVINNLIETDVRFRKKYDKLYTLSVEALSSGKVEPIDDIKLNIVNCLEDLIDLKTVLDIKRELRGLVYLIKQNRVILK